MAAGQRQIHKWISTKTQRMQRKIERKRETASRAGDWGRPTKVELCTRSRRRGNEGGSDKGIICKPPLWPPILLTRPENTNAIFPGNGIYSFTVWHSSFLLYLGWKSSWWSSHFGVSLLCLWCVCFFFPFLFSLNANLYPANPRDPKLRNKLVQKMDEWTNLCVILLPSLKLFLKTNKMSSSRPPSLPLWVGMKRWACLSTKKFKRV